MIVQKKHSLGARFGLAVASFFLAILLFVSIIATMLIADVRTVVSQDSIRSIVQMFISSPVRVRSKISLPGGNGSLRAVMRGSGVRYGLRRDDTQISGGSASQIPGGLDVTSFLVDVIYEELSKQVDGELPVPKEEFSALLEQSTVKEYLTDKAAGLISDYLVGDITTAFPQEEIITLVRENAELIESVTGQSLPEELPQQIASVITENNVVQIVEAEGLEGIIGRADDLASGTSPDGSGSMGSSSAATNLQQINEAVKMLRSVTSKTNLIIGICLCLVLMAGLVLVNLRQIGKGLRRSGYPLLLAGAPFLAASLLFTFGEFPSSGAAVSGVGVIMKKVMVRMLPIHAVVFGLGLALLIGGIVLSVVLGKKAKAVVSVNAPAGTEVLAEALKEIPTEPAPEKTTEENTSISE